MKLPEFACPVAFTNRLIGGKWKPRLIWALIRLKKLRFSELRTNCAPISDRILTKELKELEEVGFISKRDLQVMPKHTEYELTELGLTLVPLLQSMADWGLKNRDTVLIVHGDENEEAD